MAVAVKNDKQRSPDIFYFSAFTLMLSYMIYTTEFLKTNAAGSEQFCTHLSDLNRSTAMKQHQHPV